MYNCCAGECDDKDQNTGLSAGAIVGIVIGSLVFIICLILVPIIWINRHNLSME